MTHPDSSDTQIDIGRRHILKSLAAVGGLAALSGVAPFAHAAQEKPTSLEDTVIKANIPLPHDGEPEEVFLERMTRHVKEKHNLSGRELALKATDYTGTAFFLAGVYQLAKDDAKGGGHLRPEDYGRIATTLTMKALLSTKEERHHLFNELFVVNPAMVSGVAALSILGESSKADLERVKHAIGKEGPLSLDQKAFMATTIPLFTGPILSTVGSSGIVNETAHSLVDLLGDSTAVKKQKMDIQARMIAYISNWQFAGLGDPPVLELIKRTGLKGLASTAALFPLTLIGGAYTLNGIGNAIRDKEPTFPSTYQIMRQKENWEMLWRISSRSLLNGIRYATFQSGKQTPDGVSIAPFSMGSEKMRGLAKWSAGLPHVSGLMDESAYQNVIEILRLQNMREHLSHDKQNSYLEQAHDIYQRIEEARGKPADLERLGSETGGLLGRMMGDFFKHSPHYLHADGPSDEDHMTLYKRVRNWFAEFTSMENMKEHMGHSFADILLVVPWQLSAVPHAMVVLDDMATGLRGEGSTKGFGRELAVDAPLYGLNAVLSGFMDNLAGFMSFGKTYDITTSYVASMLGGGLTNIGNPAAAFNLFTLEEFPVGESIKRMGMHWPMAAVGFAYAQGLKAAGYSDYLYGLEAKRKTV